MKILRQIVDARAESFEQLASAVQIFLEGIKTFLIPARQYFLRAAGDEWNMNLDFRSLPDAIKPPDALFQKFGIKREIKQHEMMRELEIASFASNFGTNQNASAIFLGEPCGAAISLHERNAFVKHRHFDIDAFSESSVDGLDFFLRAANEKDLFLTQCSQ